MTQSKKPGPQLMCIARPGAGSDKAVVWLRGDHGLPTADWLSTAITSAAAYGTDIAVDLRGVEFMDATTLHAILRAKTAVEEQGLAVTVRQPSRVARLVLGTCGFDHLVEPGPAAPAWPDATDVLAVPAAVAHLERGVARPPPGDERS